MTAIVLDKEEIERFTKPHIRRNQIEALLGFRPRVISHYQKAFVHKSILRLLNHIPSSENVPEYMTESNERMEFLGDSILSGITAFYLYKRFPDKDEGFLSKTRSKLVDTKALSGYARKLDMGQHLLMTKHLQQIDGNNKDKILENAMEALIGAIYIDLGLDHATKFVTNLFEKHTNWDDTLRDTNFKDQLMRHCHSKSIELPVYEIVRTEGPPHDKTFIVRVLVDGVEGGEGQAKRKGDAEQKAAQAALTKV